MIPYHGTPIGAFARNQNVIRGRNLVLTWTSYARTIKHQRTGEPTESAIMHAGVAGSVLLDCGAFPFWRAQNRRRVGALINLDGSSPTMRPPIKPLDVPRILDWYRAMTPQCAQTEVIIPDVIEGGEADNDRLIDTFPVDLLGIAWPVWHTEESIPRLLRLALDHGRVCIGPMGRHSHVTGKAYTLRMIEVFNAITRDAPGTKIHALRGLQLAGGPFPFTQADSTDAGRNWSQTPHRLETCLDKWDRRARATATQWSLRDTTEAIYNCVRQTTIFDLPPVHRWSTDTLRTPS